MQGDEESPMSMQVSLNTSSILVILTKENSIWLYLREKITIAFLLGIALKTDAVVISTIILVAMVIFEHIKTDF